MLALTAALVVPYFVDWASYRADFEREASRVLGREVKVEGTASARLLPFPSVTFTDVTVAGVEPGETAVTIETFSMDAELAPFLSGEILIFDMRLVRPVVQVKIEENGGLDWAVRPSVPVDAHDITLEKLTITEGRVEVDHAASGRTHVITELNADVSAQALTGPWRLDGSMRFDGMLTKASLSTGSLDDAGVMRVRIRAEPERYPMTVEADGSARIEEGRALYDGTFKVAAGALGQELRTGDAGEIAREEDQRPKEAPYRLSGRFDLDHDALTVPEFLFETGSVEDPYTAEGSAEFVLSALPSFFVAADGAQIRFDDVDPQDGEGINLEKRLAGLREFLLDMPKPTIPGRIEVNLPAIVAGDTMVRDVRLYAEPSTAGWHLASLAATLPGRATLEADGELGVGLDALDFNGSLLLAIGQPSGFAAWLSKDVDEPIRRLPAAGFSADVELTDERQVFQDLELVLGAARFRGEIESLTPANAEPSMSVRLDGDALDVEGMTAFASLFVSDDGATRLADRKLSFEIKAGPVTAAGLTADTLDTSLRMRNDRLEIDRLSIGGLAGANLSATGIVRNPGPRPSGNLDATVLATDLMPLVSMLADRFPGNAVFQELARRAGSYPDLLTDASVDFVASTASSSEGPAGLSISSSGSLGGTQFSLTGSVDGSFDRPYDTPIRLNLSASDDDAGALYALAGLPALPLGFAGAAALELSVDGILSEGATTSLTVAGDGLNATFDGQLSRDGGALSASGEARLTAEDIAPWLTTAGATLPGSEYGLPLQLEAGLDAGDGLLVLSGVHGNFAGSSVEGDINAQMREGIPHLTGALALSVFNLDPVAEIAVGPLALQPGAGLWPDTPFAGSITSSFSTDIQIAAATLVAGDAASGRDASLTLLIKPNGIFLSGLQAHGLGGVVTGHVDFRNDGGTGLLSGQLSLDSGNPVAVVGDVGIHGVTDASVTFTASGKSIEGIVTALSGSGTASVDNVLVDGIDPTSFSELIAEADKIGPEIDATAISAFAPDLVRRGQFEAERAEIAFTLANGVVRAPPLRLEDNNGVVLSAEVGADLGTGRLNAEASLTYDPGREALVGSEPTVRLVAEGPPGDIGVMVDTEPLAQFLTQRALELEQQRVEAMQASLLEKQRYRREARYYAALQLERDEAAEAARIQAEEEERLRRELQIQEEQRRADEEEARRVDEEQRQAAEEEDRRRSEQAEQRRRDEEAARRRAVDELQREAARQKEESRQRAEQEAADRREAEEERLRSDVEALLNNRPEPPTTDTIARKPLTPPPSVDVTPRPAPRNQPSPPAAPQAQPPAANIFSERNLSLEGLLRAIGEN